MVSGEHCNALVQRSATCKQLPHRLLEQTTRPLGDVILL